MTQSAYLLHTQPQENGMPVAQVDTVSTCFSSNVQFVTQCPPPNPSLEHDDCQAHTEPPCQPEVLNVQSLQQTCHTAFSFKNHESEALQQESPQQEVSSLHALLQQVEFQHLREISLVRAQLKSQLKARAKLESHLKDLQQRVQDPESKQILQQLLVPDHTDSGDQLKAATQGQGASKTATFRNTIQVVEIPTSLINAPSGVQANFTELSTLAGNSSDSFRMKDIKKHIHRRLESQLTSRGNMLDRLSVIIRNGFYEDEEETGWAIRIYVRALVNWNAFDTFCSVTIFLSAILLGISTHQAAILCEPDNMPDSFLYADYAFTTWFLLELCLRMFADGIIRFLLGPDWNWNIFDFGVVTVDVTSTIYAALQLSMDSKRNLNVTRVVRMVRLARSLRAIRLFRFLKELRKLVLSILRSGLSLLYSMVLLCIIIFMFSVYLTQSVTFYLYDNKGENDSHIKTLRNHFGSLLHAGYILFQCITNGMDWGDVAVVLMHVHWSNSLALSLFMFFVMFAVLNMITGVFVDSALTSAQDERDEKIRNIMETEGEVVSHLLDFFGEADKDKSGSISLEELKEQLKKPMVRARLRTLEIELSDARRVFALLDIDKTGQVGIEDFIHGCLKIKGGAKSIDILIMMHQIKGMKKLMKNALTDFHERFKQQEFLANLLQTMSSQSQIEQLARIDQGWKPEATSSSLDSTSMTIKNRQQSLNPVTPAIQNGIEQPGAKTSLNL